jgi:hypothetical protein
MTDEELQREREEAERLMRQIQSLTYQINEGIQENQMLEKELIYITNQVYQLIDHARNMDAAVNEEMARFSKRVEKTDVDTASVFEALQKLTTSYFVFKNISEASKCISQYTDEYYTRFSYYNELRRITLGYVIGLDAHICSSEGMRKKVEKAYLQNTEYWLAYCIAATMLWASNEKEAASRAVSKSLSINYFNSCLYYLLINLRFRRIDAAKKWFVNYLDKVNMNDLGEEWQYLLQAYLSGALGDDQEFQEQVAKCFMDMLAKIQVTKVDFGKKITQKAQAFAETYLHKTEHEYATLWKTCAEYEDLKQLLSNAEKNSAIAKHYNQIAEQQTEETDDLAQRIENVLYSLINNYDADELKVIKNLKYNEAVVAAKGDVTAARSKYKDMFGESSSKKSLDDLLMNWAFQDEASQADIVVKRFSISFLKDWIVKGFERFGEQYRQKEQEKYTITIDNCSLKCNENDFEESRKTLEEFYDKNKLKDISKDKFVLIYIAICFASLLTLGIMVFAFSKVALVIGILLGLVGSFLLWRRIVDLGKIIKEKKRQGINRLKQALTELKQWRTSYRQEDARNIDLRNALERF